jgi:hypothetical protein
MAAFGAAVGALLGAGQVIRDNAGTWQAVHATMPTVVVQTAAGGLIGGLFVGAVAVYGGSRRVVRTLAPVAARPTRVRPAQVAAPRPALGLRHGFILVFALALLAAGGVILRACLTHPTLYGLVRGGFGAVFLLGLGGYLVWDDFVAPFVRARRARVTPRPPSLTSSSKTSDPQNKIPEHLLLDK